MQISYHFALTIIQNLQNLNIKKGFFLYRPVHPIQTGNTRNRLVWPVFKSVQNEGVSILVYIPVRYIPAGISMVSTTLGRIENERE